VKIELSSEEVDHIISCLFDRICFYSNSGCEIEEKLIQKLQFKLDVEESIKKLPLSTGK